MVLIKSRSTIWLFICLTVKFKCCEKATDFKTSPTSYYKLLSNIKKEVLHGYEAFENAEFTIYSDKEYTLNTSSYSSLFICFL